MRARDVLLCRYLPVWIEVDPNHYCHQWINIDTGTLREMELGYQEPPKACEHCFHSKQMTIEQTYPSILAAVDVAEKDKPESS